MSTLEDARMPTLRDKHLAQEAEAKAAALEKVDEVEEKKTLKAKKAKK